MSPIKNKLFLHMGPGFHSQIEANLFGQAAPSTEFWTQPLSSSFSDLVVAAETVFQSLNCTSIEILAHSFGAQLALHLVNRFPNQIGKVTLLNSGIDPFECFLNLGQKLNLISDDQAKDYRLSEAERKLELIFKVATAPDFAKSYWYSTEKMKALDVHFSAVPALDVNIFAAIFTDFLKQQELFHKSLRVWNGPVSILSSDDDVLLDFNKDIKPWTKFFPHAQFKRFQEVGHYAHLEEPSIAKIFFNI